jgi:uncharacterized damage-inducible protein DinB
MLKTALVVLALPVAASIGAAQAPSPTADARALWKGNIGFVTQAAEELTDAQYGYRPTPDVRTFGQLFAHVAGSQKMYCAMALGEKPAGEDDVEKTATTKAAILAALRESNTYCERAYALSYDKVTAPVDIFGTQHPRYYALIANASHDAEHYGNIVTYMRLNKLVPPSSRRN